jgi:signal transduction histidine kinase
LAVSKRLIEAHKGTIEVESQVGKGTTFRIRLPILAG